MLCYIRGSSSKMRLSSELFQSCVSQSSFGPNTLLQVKSYEFKALTKAINCLQINPAKTNFERENIQCTDGIQYFLTCKLCLLNN